MEIPVESDEDFLDTFADIDADGDGQVAFDDFKNFIMRANFEEGEEGDEYGFVDGNKISAEVIS